MIIKHPMCSDNYGFLQHDHVLHYRPTVTTRQLLSNLDSHVPIGMKGSTVTRRLHRTPELGHVNYSGQQFKGRFKVRVPSMLRTS